MEGEKLSARKNIARKKHRLGSFESLFSENLRSIDSIREFSANPFLKMLEIAAKYRLKKKRGKNVEDIGQRYWADVLFLLRSVRLYDMRINK